jgi:hypothetical protein
LTGRDVTLLVLIGLVAGAMLGFAFGSGMIQLHGALR